MIRLALVIHNVRSAHNVGSLLRTADGFGVEAVYLTGYSPYPELEDDDRLPHIRRKVSRLIEKTALGAEKSIIIIHEQDINKCLEELRASGHHIVALEQTPKATDLNRFKALQDIALVVGNEVTGLDKDILNSIDAHVQIPMLGHKESLNVASAAAIALYHLRWTK